MHFSTSETIAMILLVQIAAAGGAFGTGFVQEKLGSVRTLAMALMVWSVAIAMSYFAQDKSIFWMASTMMGIAMGASGTAARALVGQLSPAGQSAEFFGLWGLTVKWRQ
jgi:Permeases of the major facilitator superfamily